jgi:hypothetical protein
MDSGARIHRPDLVSLAGIGPSGYPPGFVPRCPACRYDLRGLSGSRCPECGRPFSIPRLIAQWEAKRNAGPGDADFLFAGLLCFVAIIPARMADPVQFAWKSAVLVGLWSLVVLWWRRRAEALREPSDAHRLLWVWAPCAATALGLLRTPTLGPAAALMMAMIAAAATLAAWRRAPGKTSIIVTIALAAPAAGLVLLAIGLMVQGLSGSAQGHYWSPADYPAWYWQGVPGRVRGMNNHDALAIGGVLLGIGAAALLAIAGMWVLVARLWRREAAAGSGVAVRGRRAG